MPRVGSYTYPLFRLNALLKDTKTLHEKFGTKEFTRDHVAQVLGQKSTSGGLSQKLADLKAYGLISNTQGRFTVTEIGIKATFGTDLERADSLDKAVRNISLWRAVYERCGTDPLVDTFNLELAEITGITRPESQTVAESIRKSYIEDAKYLLTVKPPTKDPEPEIKVFGKDPQGARGRKKTMEAEPYTHSIPGWGSAEIFVLNRKFLKSLREYLNNIEESLSEQPEEPNKQASLEDSSNSS